VKEDYKSAVKDFTKALELKPDHGASFFARGTCYAQLGLDEEATRDLKTAISYSEAAAQSFVDTFGILRTQFDGVLALISGERRHPGMELSEEETAKIRKWLEEE
jgi:tetratricopeptide (TPR) repeat protein